MFRYDRPQAGRMREFHQFGVEAIGGESPAVDAEAILLAYDFLTTLGLQGLTLKLNSVGCPISSAYRVRNVRLSSRYSMTCPRPRTKTPSPRPSA